MNTLNSVNSDSKSDEYKTLKVSSEMIDYIKMKLGEEVLWVYDDDTKELFLIKKPESFTEALAGLGAEMWKEVGGTEYIKQERDSWEI